MSPGHFNMQDTFSGAYLEAIGRGDRPFVAAYGRQGEVKAAGTARFHADVGRAQALLGARPEPVVATVAGNTYEHLVFLVAAVLQGKTICPLNPEEGERRIAAKLASIGEPCSVWECATRASGLPGAGPMILGNAPGVFEVKPLHGRPLALVFTSGSTGYSKVVEQREESVLSNVHAVIEHHSLGPGTVLATPLPVFHVNALHFAFFGTLLSGAKLVLWEQLLPSLVRAAFAREGITLLSLVPPLLRRLNDMLDSAPLEGAQTLKYVVTAAAPLSVDLLRATEEKLGRRVIQGYGLSEAVNFSCLMPPDLSPEDHARLSTGHRWPSIGAAVAGNVVRVRAPNGADAGEGEEGELCVRGVNVMHGYRGHLQDGAVVDGELRTGDLGFWRRGPHGRQYFFLTGRIKETVKRYGFTLSLREIDDALASAPVPGLGAIALAFENTWAGEELAFAMNPPAGWDGAQQAALVAHLEATLAPHAVPRIGLVTSEELRTASGKPCRWRLRERLEPFREVSVGRGIRFVAEEPR